MAKYPDMFITALCVKRQVVFPADTKSGVAAIGTLAGKRSKLRFTFVTEGKTQRCAENLRFRGLTDHGKDPQRIRSPKVVTMEFSFKRSIVDRTPEKISWP